VSGPGGYHVNVDANATQATPKVSDDICAAFDINKQGVFRTTTYRSNLSLQAKSFKSGAAKEANLIAFLTKNPGPSIVYVQTHDQTELLCSRLQANGFNAYKYHAGMSSDAKTTVQDKLMASTKVIVRV
jgi:superfamily II DNA helicase RecQ